MTKGTTTKKLRILRASEVVARTSIPKRTIDWLIRRGEFPRAVHMGERLRGWLEHEIEEWIQAKADARNQP